MNKRKSTNVERLLDIDSLNTSDATAPISHQVDVAVGTEGCVIRSRELSPLLSRVKVLQALEVFVIHSDRLKYTIITKFSCVLFVPSYNILKISDHPKLIIIHYY